MRDRLETMFSIVLVVAAVTVTGMVIRREFVEDVRGSSARTPAYIDAWEEMIADGVAIGDTDAPVRIIEFVDLECPFCAEFHETTLREILRWSEGATAVTVMHFPLPNHRFAESSAHAAECAGDQGRFADFVSAVFSKQDSLGLKSWSSYARDASVPDSTAFADCIAGPLPNRVEAGRGWAQRLGVTGTPAIMVNGWHLVGPPTSAELTRVIRAILEGEAPYPRAGNR